MEYNNFYFLHIDKTVGRTFHSNIIQPMYKDMEYNNINTALNKKHYDHNYWRDFDDKTYIFSVLRNPMERAISDFVYTMTYDSFGELRPMVPGDPIQRVDKILRLDLFEFWLYSIHVSNFQSRVLHYGMSNIRKHIIEKNLSRINLVVKTESLNKVNQLKLKNKIITDLNLSHTVSVASCYPETMWYWAERYGDFYKKVLESSLYKKLEEMNHIDLEIWNNAKFIDQIV